MTCSKVFLFEKDCNWNFFTCHLNWSLRHLHIPRDYLDLLNLGNIWKPSKTRVIIFGVKPKINHRLCSIVVVFGLYLKCFVGTYFSTWQLAIESFCIFELRTYRPSGILKQLYTKKWANIKWRIATRQTTVAATLQLKSKKQIKVPHQQVKLSKVLNRRPFVCDQKCSTAVSAQCWKSPKMPHF